MNNKGKRVLFSIIFLSIILVACILLNTDKKEEELKMDTLTKTEYTEGRNLLTIKDSIECEVNTKMPVIENYFDDYKSENVNSIIYYLDKKEVNEDEVIKNIGNYEVEIKIDEEVYNTRLNVVDTISPSLTLKTLTIKEGDKYSIKSFLSKCNDNSNQVCIIEYSDNKMSGYSKVGTYNIEIIAKDLSNNTTKMSTKLVIKSSERKDSNSNVKSNKSATDTKKSSNITSNKSSNVKSNKNSNVKSNNNSNNNNSKYKSTNELKSDATKLVSSNKEIANEIVSYTNSYRKEVGSNALKLDDKLSVAANVRAMEIAIYDNFAHVRPNGTSYSTVLKELNIVTRYNGENIAYGYLDSKEVSEAWKESEGHYKNMINKNYNKIGIGIYVYNNRIYWVQIFSN